MASLDLTFILGVFVLLYLSSFVLFALIRIVSGISIQRVGYFSLRRLAYAPRDGVRLELRGLGLNLHRPTFAQPTWISVVLTELAVTVDLKALDNPNESTETTESHTTDEKKIPPSPATVPLIKKLSSSRRSNSDQRSQLWEQLNRLKERIKRIHRKIHYLRMVDLVATNCSLTVVDVGTVQVGNFTMAVDTRRKMVDRRRFFAQRASSDDPNRPAEWIFIVRSVLFTPDGKDSLEILDHATLNIHGLLYKKLDGLRDAAINIKLGRIHIPIDDISQCITKYKHYRSQFRVERSSPRPEVSLLDVVEELEVPGSSNEETLAQSVSDSKEFASSILRGIKEVQFAVSHIGATKAISMSRSDEDSIVLTASMKEVGVDLHRLDPNSPAHRMYFSSKDIAHQALIAALSIAVGIDDGGGSPDRLVYIPMATMTMRTTFPSKTVELAAERSADEKNANMLFANIVITSPSIDLDPKHLPILLTLLRTKKKRTKPSNARGRTIISRLLPKANIKFSMHEPVMRYTLPPVEESAGPGDFDLIISSITSVALDLESSHSAAGQLHYSLSSTFRVQSHDLYYQTASNKRYDILQTGSLELKVSVSANPEVYVVASGSLSTFSIHMIRPEISDGVRQITRHLQTDFESARSTYHKDQKSSNFLRAIPSWLVQVQLQGSDFNAEVAGIDAEISKESRGMALQLESWTAEYRAQRLDPSDRRTSKRRASRSLTPDAAEMLKNIPSDSRKKGHPTDGRRLAFHARGLEGFVIESADRWDPESFLSVPRFEVAFSTSSDRQGPIFHVNSMVKTMLLHYSLYRHYAIGVAVTVLQKALMQTKADKEEMEDKSATRRFDFNEHLSPLSSPEDPFSPESLEFPFTQEIVTVDAKITYLQIKAHMPSDPAMMIQVHGLDAGHHRWSPPFLQSKMMRLYVEAPKMKQVWVRLISIKTLRADFRERKRKMHGSPSIQDDFIDVRTEAIRLAVPHQVVLHKIFDNLVNTMKASEQLHHRFKTETNDYILEKKPSGPKKIPKISLRSKAFTFELEDGAFEWKLGTIYRAGLVEQQQRLAREQAFQVKARRIEEEERRDSNRTRNRSAHHRGSVAQGTSARRTKSEDYSPKRTDSSENHRGRQFRYDPEGVIGLSAKAQISIDEAYQRLQRHNSQSWKQRIDASYRSQKAGMKDIRSIFWGPDEVPDEMDDSETILEIPQRPALMATLISDLHIMIDKPSFPIEELPDYLHRVGKGMPKDMKYSLLIPMHVQLNMGEARMTLRDYPLPLLHVPAAKRGQSRLPSWSMKTDFVIAEEYRGPESRRHVKVTVVPPRSGNRDKPNSGEFAIDVLRTVAPVKSFSEIDVTINTPLPTRITWGTSYQPAIQDMMMVIETFTKPQVDPSDRTGFWDKIRLSFHSRINVAWKGDGDVHLILKGSRDPYVVTGNGAGFLMCWRNDVRWCIHGDDDPRKFMTVDSGEYVLAVPDFSSQARASVNVAKDDDSISTSSTDSFRHGTLFKKVVMKLSGKVQWVAGLVFERNAGDSKRSFEFRPHYDVVFREPRFAKAPPGEEYDALRGFRSHHIHMSVAVKAPVDRDWSVSNSSPSRSYNTVHLTPRFFTHFFAWWSNFGGNMSLPIRQGRLWPGVEKSSKKFGRHLATIKYSLLLAPLFLSHIYKHKDVGESDEPVSATGIKGRLDSFMLDVHQRREEFRTSEKDKKRQGRTSGMKMHKAQLDLISADVRAVSATMAEPTPEDLRKAMSSGFGGPEELSVTDLSNFTIPDNDYTWVDMDDFVELDWILPSQSHPETTIMPLVYAPRFTYFRETDHGDSIDHDPDRTSPFGNEVTHFCTMSKDDDPRRVQQQLVQERLEQLKQQTADHDHDLGEAELRMIQDDGQTPAIKADFEKLSRHSDVLRDKKAFLEAMAQRMGLHTDDDSSKSFVEENGGGMGEREDSPDGYEIRIDESDPNAGREFISDFNNRFVIHNMQLKWNNALRNIILRYIHQVGQRRGFVYYLSRRAVKFILDIVEEQNKAKASKAEPRKSTAGPSRPSAENDSRSNVDEIINDLLADGKNTVLADEPSDQIKVSQVSADELDANIGDDFTPQNSYHLRIIAPQIQLQSEKNKKAVLLLTAKGMELKVVEVMDKDRLLDNVSGLVQRRFSVEMDSTQFFVTQQRWFSSQLLSLYSGSRYGTPAGSAWPPWVPLEVMFDFKTDPFGFRRVVQKTSASLRYDKYNTLRLKFNDEVAADKHKATPTDLEDRMDHLWVEFPQVRAICDSSQYYAMYIIVLDLLLYSEPLEKVRNERLEKIMLASDFSDLRGAPQMVIRLQERIRQLEEIKTQFQIHSTYLDRQGWEDRMRLEQDLVNCEDELFFMMKAITTSQRKYDGSQSSGLLRWNISSEQIVWHLMRDQGQPLVEFQLQRAEYDRTDNSDGSHLNLVKIEKIVGLNLLPDAVYPEIISPYFEHVKDAKEVQDQGMVRVYWHMLEAIAGIPVMDHFEVNLFPVRIQLEREVGKKLFEYIFPGTGDNPNVERSSPLLVKNMPPVPDDEEMNSGTPGGRRSIAESDSGTGTPGSLEYRLRPTLTSEANTKASSGAKLKPPSMYGDNNHFRLFQGGSSKRSSSTAPSFKGLTKKVSAESLKSVNGPRPGIGRSATVASMDAASTNSEGKNKRFTFAKNGGKSQEDQKKSDDLTKMMSRASNYMTLAYVTIPSVTMCLSYKGKGERNIEDVHDFVFRLPTLEYRNKTWSNLDLALALKKDVIRALISHTGAIIGNKFKHRPTTAQQSRLRELATSNTLLTPTQDSSYDNSDADSNINISPVDVRRSEDSQSPRRSFTSTHTGYTNFSGLSRADSRSSSTRSFKAGPRAQSFPASMRMTPITKNPTRTNLEGSGNNQHEADAPRRRSEAPSTISHESTETRAGRLSVVGRKLHLRREADSSLTPTGSSSSNSETVQNGNSDDAPTSSSTLTPSSAAGRKFKAALGKKLLGSLTDH